MKKHLLCFMSLLFFFATSQRRHSLERETRSCSTNPLLYNFYCNSYVNRGVCTSFFDYNWNRQPLFLCMKLASDLFIKKKTGDDFF